MIHLKILKWHQNKLVDHHIPTEIESLTKLYYHLDLSANLLAGEIPTENWHHDVGLGRLLDLGLGTNMLTGGIPSEKLEMI
jgi:hypothetical protein